MESHKNQKLLKLFILLSTFLITAVHSAGTIKGVVYRDYNSDGIQNIGVGIGVGDPGITNILVNAYDSNNNSQGSIATLADGTFALTASGTDPYRIEFTSIPSYLHPGEVGTNSNTTVQYVPVGNSNNINLGLNNPADY